MKRIFALLLCLLPSATLAQEDDKGFLVTMLEDQLSGAGRQVVIDGFEGALSSQATLKQLTIADDLGIWLTLRDVTLDWSRAALLRGEVSVKELTAGEIIVARAPVSQDTALPPAEAQPFALPDLPVSVDIGRIAAARIELGDSLLGQPVTGTLEASGRLSGGEGKAELVLDRTDTGPEGHIRLTAGFANATQVLALDLSAAEGAGGIVTTLAGLPGAPAVELTVKGEGPLTGYRADLQLASNGAERLKGQVTLGTTEAGGTTFAADLGGDLAPLFLPDYRDFFGTDLRLVAKGARDPAGRVVLDQFALNTQALRLAGTLALAADGLPERFDLTGALGLDGRPVVLPISGPIPTAVDHADLTLGFDAAAGAEWRAKIALTGLDRADLKLAQASLTGRGHITRGAKPTIDGTLDFDATGLAPADAALATALGQALRGQIGFLWQDGAPTFGLPLLQLSGADYRLTAHATLGDLANGLTVTGDADLTADNLARFSALAGRPLGGSGRVQMRGNGALLAGSFDLTGTATGQNLTLGLPEADRLLAGPSTIGLSVRRDETGTTLRQLTLNATTLSLGASGKIATAGSDIGARLAFTDLSVLGPGYKGGLTAETRFTGTPENGRVTAKATGTALAIGQPEADRLLAGTTGITADLALMAGAVQIHAASLTNDHMALQAHGRYAASGSDIGATLRFADLSVLGPGYRGGLAAETQFTGTPENGRITAKATGTALAIGQPEADRLLAGTTALEADVTLKDGDLQITAAKLGNKQLSAQITGAVTGGKPSITLEAGLQNLALLLPEFPGRVKVAGRLGDTGQGYALDLAAEGPGGIRAKAAGTVAPGFDRAVLGLTGSAQAALANAFIAPRNVSGLVNFDLKLNGPLALSSVNGRIRLADGRLSDPDLPFALQGIAVTANLAGSRATLDTRADLSSGGRITARGTVGLQAPFTGDLTAQLDKLHLKDPRLYETRLNGTVTVKGPLTGGALIGGDISLIEAELRIPDTGLGGAAGITGLRHKAEPRPVLVTRDRAGLVEKPAEAGGGGGKAFPLNLRLLAPQRVFVRGRGLDAELGGSILLQGTTAQVVPSGAFNLVRGRLDILGKRLTLTQALLQMEGELVPYVDIIASNEASEITSSVEIKGQATNPTVSFVSSPELPQEEVLSQLLFGRDLTSLSAFQAAQLAAAVATLAGKGGDGILSKLRKGFDLDDLDIATDADGGTTVKAGKYLSKNLYTEVGVGDDGQASISLNLDVTKNVTIKGTAGGSGETSLGIFKEYDY